MHFQNKTTQINYMKLDQKKKDLMQQCNSSFGDKHLRYDTGTWELY